MRVWLSWARVSVVAVVVVATMSAPVVVTDASSAGAALPPVSGCGFRLGAIANQGAAGTVFYSVVLEPNSPAQHCTAAVTFTATATIAPQFASHGQYHNIAHNPLTATEVVGFTPGRLAARDRNRVEWLPLCRSCIPRDASLRRREPERVRRDRA